MADESWWASAESRRDAHLAGVVNQVGSLTEAPRPLTGGSSGSAVALGFVTARVSDGLFRASTSLTTTPAVNNTAYAESLLSLLWLQLAYGLNVQKPALVLTGNLRRF